MSSKNLRRAKKFNVLLLVAAIAVVGLFSQRTYDIPKSTLASSVPSTVTVGTNPLGVAVAPDGNFVYVANAGSNFVSVIYGH